MDMKMNKILASNIMYSSTSDTEKDMKYWRLTAKIQKEKRRIKNIGCRE